MAISALHPTIIQKNVKQYISFHIVFLLNTKGMHRVYPLSFRLSNSALRGFRLADPQPMVLRSWHGCSSIRFFNDRKKTCLVHVERFQQNRKMASSSSEDLSVKHDPTSNKFSIKLGEAEAKLEYVRKGDTMDMWHTEVPPALQGKGIAKILAQEAFDFVVKNDLKMKLSCTYLQKYYKDNPKDEYKKRVVG